MRVTGAALVIALLSLHAPPALGAPAVLDTTRLSARVAGLAAGIRPGVVGVGVELLGGGGQWFLNGDRPLPMQSVFKAPLAAAVLDAADRGALRLDSVVVLRRTDLSVPYSPVAEAFPGRAKYTIEELLEAAVAMSDNTAADLLMRGIGGPRALTAWLRRHGVDGISVDRYEHDLQPNILALGRFRPEYAVGDSMDRAKRAVPERAGRAAMRAYFGGTRDMMTPRGAIAFLAALESGRLVSPDATRRLLKMMTDAMTGMNRLRAGLPEGAALAHKTGTGPTVLGVATAANDIGIVTLRDGTKVAIAVLLSGATAAEPARDSTIAAVAREVIASVR